MARRGAGLLIGGLVLVGLAAGAGGAKATTPAKNGAKQACIARWADYLARQFEAERDAAKLATAAGVFQGFGWDAAASCAHARAAAAQMGRTDLPSCYQAIFDAVSRDLAEVDDPQQLRDIGASADNAGLPEIGACMRELAGDLEAI